MTYENAKDIIAECRHCNKNIGGTCTDNKSGCFSAHKMAVDAIYKQIPKELTIQTEVYAENSTYICPNCGRLFGYVRYGTEGIENAEINYCPRCGQAIKWESEGEHE